MTMEPNPNQWLLANRQHLMAEIARVRCSLEWYVEHRCEPNVVFELPGDSLDPPSALDTLVREFELGDFERDLLTLCAGFELDDQFGALCASVSGDSGARRPTFGVALAALPNPDWNALLPVSALRCWRMVDLEPAPSLTSCPLRLDERILHQLMGVGYLDERLQGLVKPVSRPTSLPGSYRVLTEKIIDSWRDSQAKQHSAWPLVLLTGDATGGKLALAAAASAALGLKLHVVKASDIPESFSERDVFARLWNREAILSHSALLIDTAAGAASQSVCWDFMDRVQGLILYAGPDSGRPAARPILRVEVNRPAAAEQRVLWQSALGPAGAELNGRLDAVTSQFSLDAEQIRTLAEAIQSDSSSDAPLANRLWETCRNETRRPLDKLAERIPAAATWNDLVLPDGAQQTLSSIGSHVRKRDTVYEKWGFAAAGARGLGVTALFAGPSGTGKTMAAEVLAAELNLDLYRIDLSQIVSKYIGETEKNLHSVFEGAEGCGAILLFDEADALFGKRSEVKDSHDRYANIEVSYLLQRMEAYTGLAILTTNMRTALDTAFLRRIRFVVNFPFPDAAHRKRIWQRIFPHDLPRENLDTEKLAKLNVSGGSIRNIAMTAAFLAADEGEPVRMIHLMRGAESECQKLDKPVSSAELGGWV